ncbi:YesU family protein [Paenibacillus glycanilyticus]|uniref:YesU family protein n=1 Tax=Paenibacillus glycanilyticus TaxID=126569 RepID=UPI0020419AA7|nr:YesU family protein [Paenibacillus glycanilyticus]MCM3626620.1 YesU family protein [Paenibacillus glycanilyticus]
MKTEKRWIPAGWRMIYNNPLSSAEEVSEFRMEGDGAVSFPMGRMRLESTRDPAEGQASNLVFWCPEQFPADMAVTWDFWPVREPGLAILFFCAAGREGQDLFNSGLAERTGIYEQYHHGDINAFHVSYFRRRYPEERKFHTCNLRKSHGFHLVAQGADPIPAVADAAGPYRMQLLKQGPYVQFAVNDLLLFSWRDDGSTWGPLLGKGKLGFRQMAPLIAEYGNLQVYAP